MDGAGFVVDVVVAAFFGPGYTLKGVDEPGLGFQPAGGFVWDGTGPALATTTAAAGSCDGGHLVGGHRDAGCVHPSEAGQVGPPYGADPHHVAGVGGVDHEAVTDVNANVVDVRLPEEHEVPG